jgi:hypothetical protein
MKYCTACPAKQLLAIPAAVAAPGILLNVPNDRDINRKHARKAGAGTPCTVKAPGVICKGGGGKLLLANPLANIHSMMSFVFLTSILFADEVLTAFSLTEK